jgi:DNA segregation ATPase FtsK/SpoIIIE, S-DNA-T family
MGLELERALLKSVSMGHCMDGRTWHMPIEGQHIFIAAATGSGKGSWIWTLVLGLAPAWRAGLVKFWGCDPKMIELAIGRDAWDYYADNDEDSVTMLEQCVDAMHERTKHMQGMSRKFQPSVDFPLNVLVIDEMGYLAAYLPDKRLRERADKAVRALLAKGRAPGFAVVGAVQDPRKETCGYRDQFSIRIAGHMTAPMVDLVLGEGAYDAGAWCDRIPSPHAGGAGVAYVLDEVSMKPLMVRAPWCSDETIQRVLTQSRQQTVSTGNYVKDEDLSGQQGWTITMSQQLNFRLE